MTVRRALAGGLVALALAGCGGGRSAPTTAAPSASVASSSVPSASPTAVPTPTRPGAAAATRPDKVLVVVLENHSFASAWRQMPFLKGLALRYGYASSYTAVAHPSLPNYLAIAGGSTFGVRDDAGPSAHPLSGSSAFGQAVGSGRTARVYAEAMPSPCFRSSTPRYAVKHNPWPYFTGERSACRRDDVPAGTATAGAFAADVRAGTLPHVGLLVPDICHDGHDCPLSIADGWLRDWLSPALQGPDFSAGRLAVVVTFDEDDHLAGNRVVTVVASRSLRGLVVRQPLSHYGLSRWMSEVAGGSPLRRAAQATSVGSAFGLG